MTWRGYGPAPGSTLETAVNVRPFESVVVRYEWHARDGRFGMRAEGNGESPAYSREKVEASSIERHYLQPTVKTAAQAYNARPLLTPYKGLVRWWKASCAEMKRAAKDDTKAHRTRTDKRATPTGLETRKRGNGIAGRR